MLHVSMYQSHAFRSQRMFCSFVFFKNQDDCASVFVFNCSSLKRLISVCFAHKRTCNTSSRRWLAVSKTASSPKVSTSTDVVVGSRQQSKCHVRISSR